MPTRIAGSRLCGEQEADLGDPAHTGDTHRPVLIVARELWIPGASLTYDVQQSPLLRSVKTDPGFERNRVAVGEVEVAVRSWIGQNQARSFSIQEDGRIVVREIGILGTPGTGLISLHAPLRRKPGTVFRAEIPTRDEVSRLTRRCLPQSSRRGDRQRQQYHRSFDTYRHCKLAL